MNPFPKAIGVIGVLAAVFGALNVADVLTVLPHGIANLITVGSSILAALSHSLTGTGGKDK